ncbi:hypothetical protein [Cupriavidus necator]|uniref:hypothetical protein n=1 Tax=Cupriavidus necator TaxID=106590 RepID=UPI0027872AB8|nr:hypothetical protein [Cupriavidus necator]MDQ0142755.1 hypothetical protein [Cupriavidus necator]
MPTPSVPAPNASGIGAPISLVAPGEGGVKDYAATLNGLLQGHLVEATPALPAAALAGADVVLHYCGYGYARRGTPLWLLRRLREARPRMRRFGIFFHELYADGAPWRSAFWLSPVQRYIAAELASLADFWLTNREGSARWLNTHAPARPHRVLPVFSNLGESGAPPGNRQAAVVVLGGSALRAQTYQEAGDALFDWVDRAGFTLHDVGPPLGDAGLAARIAQRGAVVHGRVEAADAARLLSASTYGVLAYPVDYAAKSGVFAAYCAHAVCPVLLSRHGGVHDGITPGHYLPAIQAMTSDLDVAWRIGRAANAWYAPHALRHHEAGFRELLEARPAQVAAAL